MNETHYNINSERTGNILMYKELNFLENSEEEWGGGNYTRSETEKSEVTIHDNWWNQLEPTNTSTHPLQENTSQMSHLTKQKA